MKKVKKATLIFGIAFVYIIAVLGLSVLKIRAYNSTRHHKVFSGATLFNVADTGKDEVSVNAVARSSTWNKIFDFS